MTVFFVIGGVGIALLLLALFVGDVLDGALGFDGIDSWVRSAPISFPPQGSQVFWAGSVSPGRWG